MSPTCTPIETIRADVPPGTIRLFPESDRSIWLIFPPDAARAARGFVRRYHRTWAETGDHCWFIDYRLTWKDVNGWGVELAQYAGPGTQLRRIEGLEEIARLERLEAAAK